MYHAFKAEDGSLHGSFEVFYVSAREAKDDDNSFTGPGWYWWACFPGSLPDGDPMGPFATEAAALANAREAA